jgi:hypothetical protein
MIDERVEHSRRIAAPPDAGHDHVGQAAKLPAALVDGFTADHRLEVADDPRKRVRADNGADDVVGVLDRAHPVAHRLVDRVPQGS